MSSIAVEKSGHHPEQASKVSPLKRGHQVTKPVRIVHRKANLMGRLGAIRRNGVRILLKQITRRHKINMVGNQLSVVCHKLNRIPTKAVARLGCGRCRTKNLRPQILLNQPFDDGFVVDRAVGLQGGYPTGKFGGQEGAITHFVNPPTFYKYCQASCCKMCNRRTGNQFVDTTKMVDV